MLCLYVTVEHFLTSKSYLFICYTHLKNNGCLGQIVYFNQLSEIYKAELPCNLDSSLALSLSVLSKNQAVTAYLERFNFEISISNLKCNPLNFNTLKALIAPVWDDFNNMIVQTFF